jgi:hypothetical protein
MASRSILSAIPQRGPSQRSRRPGITRTSTLPNVHQRNNLLAFVWPEKLRQVSDSHGFAQLLEREQIGCECLAVSEFRGAITTLRVQKIDQGEAAAVVGVIGDVPGLLGGVSILVPVQQDHSFTGFQSFVDVIYVSQY